MSTGSSGLSGYRTLPATAGWNYLLATAFGKFPMAMIPLAVLTLSTSATGSLAVGGFAAAAAAVCEAVGAPTTGTMADRWGQRNVLLAGVVVNVTVLVAFTLGAGVLPDTVTVALAGLAGLTIPQVGALSRARWLALLPRETQTAFAFEGVTDEISYIFGPALVGILAVTVSPQAAMFATAGLITVFVTQFAVHRTHRLVPRRSRSAAERAAAVPVAGGALRRRALLTLCVTGTVAMGVFFGGSQAGLTAFSGEMGLPDAGALLYAVMAVGSTVTTLAMVMVPDRIGPWLRWSIAGAGMLVGAVLLLAATSIPAVLIAGLVAGAFQGPMLLTIFGITGSLTAQGSGGFMMALLNGGVVIGIGVGAATAGPLAEQTGSAGAFWLVAVACALLFALGICAGIAARIRRRRPVLDLA